MKETASIPAREKSLDLYVPYTLYENIRTHFFIKSLFKDDVDLLVINAILDQTHHVFPL